MFVTNCKNSHIMGDENTRDLFMYFPLTGINNRTYGLYLEVQLRRISWMGICYFDVYTIIQFFLGWIYIL